MKKIDRTPVQLKANVSQSFPVNGQIDSERGQIFLRFNPQVKDIILNIKFVASSGRNITEPINIKANGSNNLTLDVIKLLSNREVEITSFVSVEFTSSDDFIFEFWAEEGEVIFGL